MPSCADLSPSHWSRAWAGQYYAGDGLGTNILIDISPNAGITLTNHGCGGLYGANYGQIVATLDVDGDLSPDGVKVKWALPTGSCEGYDCESLYFIRWNGPSGSPGRKYLVPETQMADFVKSYNARGWLREKQFNAPIKVRTEFDGSRNVHRRPDPVIAKPILPAPWAGKLKYSSEEATITKVLAREIRSDNQKLEWLETKVVLDRGTKSGLKPGTMISLDGYPGFVILTVLSAESQSSEALYRVGYHREQASPYPAIGQIISIDHRAKRER